MTVMDTVSEMANRGCAVIMVCHDMEVVSDFAERLVVMANGRILDRGAALDMFSDTSLMKEAFIEAPQIVQLSQVLSHTISPAFAGISQVSGIVDLTEEMVQRG
jgi:ABC-type hemin transport system ATPase subunit